MMTFIIIIACYLLGLCLGLIYRSFLWLFLTMLTFIWWLVKKIGGGLLYAIAFSIGYGCSYIKHSWHDYQAKRFS